jgi:Trypsin-like peptidase domain
MRTARLVGALLGAALCACSSPRGTSPKSSPSPAVPAAEAYLPPEPPPRTAPSASAEAASDPLEAVTPLSVEEIVKRSMPSIVTVQTSDGLGSGFFVAPDTVVTNSHVVSGETKVTLRRANYLRPARVEKDSPSVDLAILKLDVVDLDQLALPLGLPSDVHLGAEVVAIGSPLGFENTVTRGIVSGVREKDGVRLIQTDAAINPGNSGGPLLDRYGRVLGVNTMKLVGGVESMAFAVSIQYVRMLLGGEFAGNPDGRQRGEDATREYAENVKRVAQHADAVDENWKKFKASCEPDQPALATEREWLAFADDRPAPAGYTPSCRSWFDYFTESAAKTRDALKRLEEAARAAGASPTRLRVIRRRYNVDWPA